MSKNNQLLVKEHKGKFYVFDVPAESWMDKSGVANVLSLDEASGSFDTRKEAHAFAHALDAEILGSSEYGVVDEMLAKDGQDVAIEEKRR